MESQNVHKLFLVDQFDRVYKELQRPIQAVAKTKRSINLGRTLQDEHLTEDEKVKRYIDELHRYLHCLLYTSPSPRDRTRSRMPSSA